MVRVIPNSVRAGLLLILAFGRIGDQGGPFTSAGHVSAATPDSHAQELTVAGKALLHNEIEAGQLPDLLRPNYTNYRSDVGKLYDLLGGALAWIQDRKPTPQARAMVVLLENAEYQGLRPADYDGPRWHTRLTDIDGSTPATEADLVQFDLALTVSTMRYLSDLEVGRVNPQKAHFSLDVGPTKSDLSEFVYRKLILSSNVEATVGLVEPPFPIYSRTKLALKNYLNLANREDSSAWILPVPSKTVKPGTSYPAVSALQKKLALLGDLPENTGTVDGVYQGATVQGVKHFQERHGLEANGLLDAATLKELNTPLSERVVQLELTMERARWVPRAFDRPPIVVNIPEFRVYAVDENYHWVFSMKVVVGRAYKHKTPVFASTIQAVIFRPYWAVPLSIVRAELLPSIQKDPSYVAKNSYEIVDKLGTVISEGPVNQEIEEGLRTGALTIRQTPGPKNALGLVEFDIPRSDDVYMHGTPETTLFSRSRRDFSHGCIRVEDPVALAKWVLRDMPEWNEENIRAAMNGDRTLRVKLGKPIPVLILYGTAVVAENGEVRFFDDVYGFDASLQKALSQGYPYETSSDVPAGR